MEEETEATSANSSNKNLIANHQIYCPWTSKAPVGSSTNKKPCKRETSENSSSAKEAPQSEPSRSAAHTPNYFYHFLRLMQLFPNVHPATLHSALSLCNHDFLMAVEKLLYSKRWKEFSISRRNYPFYQQHSSSQFSSQSFRVQPYTNTNSNNNAGSGSAGCLPKHVQAQTLNGHLYNIPMSALNSGDLANIHYSVETDVNNKDTQIIMLDAKKLVSRNRKQSASEKFVEEETSEVLIPVEAPQCTLPIQALSPMNNLSQEINTTLLAMKTCEN